MRRTSTTSLDLQTTSFFLIVSGLAREYSIEILARNESENLSQG